MTLRRTLTMPLQLTSLLFVGFIATLLTLVTSIGGETRLLAILPLFILLSWLNKYAFALLDQAAHGDKQAPVASVEMLGPFNDLRVWVHPGLAAAVVLTAHWLPQTLLRELLIPVLLLFPASIGALAISHNPLDAVNPAALWRVLHALGLHYVLLAAATVAASVIAFLVMHAPLWNFARFMALALLLLTLYAAIGGTLFARRIDLDFAPRNSPERGADRDEQERLRQRQALFDELYTTTRVREYARAAARIEGWLTAVDGRDLGTDVAALIAQAAGWPEPRATRAALRAVLGHCLRVGQPALALGAAEAILARLPGFAPTAEAETLALAAYARQTGRPRLAQTLLDNFAAATRSPPQKR